jgi:hypothetical protein
MRIRSNHINYNPNQSDIRNYQYKIHYDNKNKPQDSLHSLAKAECKGKSDEARLA